MPNGTIANGVQLAATGWSSTSTSYGFYVNSADLPSVYTGRVIDYPQLPGPPPGPNPANALYTAKFLTTTTAERDFIRDTFATVGNLTDQSFTEAPDATTSDIGIGAVDVRPPNGSNFTAGWGGHPGSVLTGDFWLAEDGREGAAGNYFYRVAAHELMHTLGLKDGIHANLGPRILRALRSCPIHRTLR